MARLTLSEQVEQLKEELQTVTEQLLEASKERSELDFAHRELVRGYQAVQAVADKVPGLEEQVAKLTKELESKESSRKFYNDRCDKAEAELEQVHGILDDLDGVAGREYERPDTYGKTKRTAVARVMSALLWQAKRG